MNKFSNLILLLCKPSEKNEADIVDDDDDDLDEDLYCIIYLFILIYRILEMHMFKWIL